MMKPICVRKVRTVESNNDFFVFFEEGDITKPILFLTDYETSHLLRELINACELPFKFTDEGKLINLEA